ncbi:MAG: CAP domain-containing protein [Pirellulaceae bacterium]
MAPRIPKVIVMWRPQLLLFLAFATLVSSFAPLAPSAARGQIVEEDEGESVKIVAANPDKSDDSLDLAEVAREIVSRTNRFRRKQDRRAVRVDPQLAETAQYFADFMARTDKYGHHADGNGPAERATQHAYDYCIVSENIAYQFNSAGFTTEELAKGFFQGWKHSPGHRKNMLDSDVVETGVAVARSDESGYYYAVQMFGRPESKRIEFQITNQSNAVIEYDLGGKTFPLPPRLTRTHHRCRPAELIIQWPEEQESTALQPSRGGHYTIVRQDSGKLRVRQD